MLWRVFGPKRDLTVREERRLRVFENRVLRGIFGPKMDKVTGELEKLHNEELSDLYCSFAHSIYMMSQEEWTKLRESVRYVKIYRYNPKRPIQS